MEEPALSVLCGLAMPEILSAIADALQCAVERNEPLGRGPVTRFHAKDRPPASIEAYLKRLVQFLPCRLDSLLLAVVFLERVSRAASTSILLDRTRADPDGPVPMDTTEPSHFLSMASPDGSRKSRRPILNAWTIHRLLLASIVVGSKFIADPYIPQDRAAKVGGVTMPELGQLEIELLVQLRFELLWDPSVLERVAEDILARMPAVDAPEETRSRSPRPQNRRHPSLFCAQVPATGPAPVIAPVARPAAPSEEEAPPVTDEDALSTRTSSEEPSSPTSTAPSSLPSDQESPDSAPAASTSLTPKMKATTLTPRTPPASHQTFRR